MQTERLEAYYNEVMRFSKALNLTSIRDHGEFFDRFIEPSLALAAMLPETGRLLDIGSGMGVPGIPILLTKPGLHGVLVERRKKRAEFLRHLGRTLKLSVEVFDADIRDLPPLGVDICVARAVTREAELLEMCSPHVNRGAAAVFPVPQGSVAALVEGWQFVRREVLRAGAEQWVHQYEYREVSRET